MSGSFNPICDRAVWSRQPKSRANWTVDFDGLEGVIIVDDDGSATLCFFSVCDRSHRQAHRQRRIESGIAFFGGGVNGYDKWCLHRGRDFQRR
ncbi:MAG: hypothetical protein AB4426_26090 [Xenococcaceae cyanobacterium]